MFRMVMIASLVGSCMGGSSSDDRISITGSSTIAPLVAEFAKAFEKKNPGLQIDVQTGGSSRGIADARSGLSDIGMVSRALKGNESDLTPYLIARDGVAVIVNKSISLKDISKDDLQGVFTKKIENWKSLGGPDQKIVVVHKAQGRSTAEVFTHYLGRSYGQIKADIIIGDNEQGIKNVAAIPGSIAYVSIGAAEVAIAQGTAIRLLKLDGVIASSDNVANSTFPIRRELNLVVSKNNKALKPYAQKFIAFMLSDEAFPFVRKLDFVPVKKLSKKTSNIKTTDITKSEETSL